MIRAYLGGSFNPIHQGHIQLALEACELLAIKQLTLLPCKDNELKKIDARFPSNERLEKLAQVCEKYVFLQVDYRELKAPQKHSYTIDTLRDLHQRHPHDTLVFIMGSDSFYTINQWKEWQHILDYCHLMVFNRLGYQVPQSIDTQLKMWINDNQMVEKEFLNRLNTNESTDDGMNKEKYILINNMRKPINISSSEIRLT